jgi:peroxiredoxin
MDSPAANAAYAKQIGVTFPLLSDMNRKALTAYGILRKRDVQGVEYAFAERTTFIVDKSGIIRHIEAGDGAVDPSSAISVCTMLGSERSK